MIKVTFIFNNGRASPTESHYSSAGTTFASVGPQAAQLATLRASLLGYGATLNQVRLSDSANPRDVILLDASTFNGKGPYNAPATVPGAAQVDVDQANASVLARVLTSRVPKNYYLSNVPDDIIGTGMLDGTNLTPSFNPQWFSYWQTYAGIAGNPPANALCSGRWGCLEKQPSNQQVCTAAVPIGAYAPFASVITAQPLAAIVGGKILVKGFRSVNPRLRSLSGVYKVLAILTGNQYVLAGTTAAEVANVQNLPGSAYDLTYSVATYTYATLVKGTSRRRGGSVGLPRGRSRTRR